MFGQLEGVFRELLLLETQDNKHYNLPLRGWSLVKSDSASKQYNLAISASTKGLVTLIKNHHLYDIMKYFVCVKALL